MRLEKILSMLQHLLQNKKSDFFSQKNLSRFFFLTLNFHFKNSMSKTIVFQESDDFKKLELPVQIRLRPVTYIGSPVEEERDQFLLNDAGVKYFSSTDEDEDLKKDDIKFELRRVKIVPGLCKLPDEGINNIPDHNRRGAGTDEAEVTIERKTGIITFRNNGTCIPCEI